jgi:hypothetical protein|tara:strand:- start:3718 stop:3897 length:180 start_codon:yes stop_codon:yes gene_type:complete
MSTVDMQKPQNYIIVNNEDGTYSAFVNYGVFETKEDAEKSLEFVMDMMGFKLQPQITYH